MKIFASSYVVGERKKSPTPLSNSLIKLRGNETLTQKSAMILSLLPSVSPSQALKAHAIVSMLFCRLIRRGWISRIGYRRRNKICPIDDGQSRRHAFTHHLYRLCEKHVHQCNLLDSSDENASRGSKVGV